MADYDRLRQVRQSMLLGCLCWQKGMRGDHVLSHAHPHVCQHSLQEHRGDEAQTKDILFADFVAHMEEEPQPRSVMFREMVRGGGYSFGQNDWTGSLEHDLKEFGLKSEGWRDGVQKASRWF